MKDEIIAIFKKFWFVILIGVLFIGMAIYCAWDMNKDKLSAKSVDGKDVVFTLADENYTADSYYKALFNTMDENSNTKTGIATVYNNMEKVVANEAIDTTDKMKDDAEKASKQFSSQAQMSEDEIKNQLKALGYDSLEDYYLTVAKRQKLINDYIAKDKQALEIAEKQQPRKLQHILVKCADPDNPTKEEKEKMNKIDEALKNGADFGAVAKEYSDDPGSAKNNGSLGVVLKNGSLVKEFEDAAWKLKAGETTKSWVKTKFGYHLIKNDKIADKAIKDSLKNGETVEAVKKELLTKNPNYEKQVIYKEAKKLGLKVNKDIKKDLDAFINGK